LPNSWVRAKIKNEVRGLWNIRWNEEISCRMSRHFMPAVPPNQSFTREILAKPRKNLTCILAWLTGHDKKLKYFSHVIYKDQQDLKCRWCSEEDEVPIHITLWCPAFTDLRRNLMTSLRRKNKSLEDLEEVEKGSIEDIFLGLERNTGLNNEEIGQNSERDERVNILMGPVAVNASFSDEEGNVNQNGSDSSGILDMTRDSVEQEQGRRRQASQVVDTETQQVVIINLSNNEELEWRMGPMELTPEKALKGWPTTSLKEDERGYLPGLTADEIRMNEKRAQGVGVNMSLKLIETIREEHVRRSREGEVQNEHNDSTAS
jgi:hypothetical protein